MRNDWKLNEPKMNLQTQYDAANWVCLIPEYNVLYTVQYPIAVEKGKIVDPRSGEPYGVGVKWKSRSMWQWTPKIWTAISNKRNYSRAGPDRWTWDQKRKHGIWAWVVACGRSLQMEVGTWPNAGNWCEERSGGYGEWVPKPEHKAWLYTIPAPLLAISTLGGSYLNGVPGCSSARSKSRLMNLTTWSDKTLFTPSPPALQDALSAVIWSDPLHLKTQSQNQSSFQHTRTEEVIYIAKCDDELESNDSPCDL